MVYKTSEIDPTWQRTGLAAYSGNGSIRISSQYMERVNIEHELISPELDFSNQTTSAADPLLLYFDLAYAKRLPYNLEDGSSIINDLLAVYVSKNCGESWIKELSGMLTN